MIAKLKQNPTVVAAVLSLIGAVAGLLIKNEQLAGALLGVFAAFLGLRQVVTPVTTAVTEATGHVTEMATEVGVEVARQLSPVVVGTVGEVTTAARGIVADVVGKVLPG